MNYFHPNPGSDKPSVIENPAISSIALQYLAYEKTVHENVILNIV